MSDVRTRCLSPKTIAALTVTGWNVLAMAPMVALLAYAIWSERTQPTDREGFVALGLAVVTVFVGAAIAVSFAIGLIVTSVRASANPAWLGPTVSTGRAVLLGSGAAAWGLVVPIGVFLLFVHP